MDLDPRIIVAPPVFDAVAYFGILGLACSVTALTAILYGNFDRKDGISFFAVWASAGIALSLAAASGTLARFDLAPPPFIFVVLIAFIGPIVLGMSSFGGRIASSVPLRLLVLVQAFRLPLELVMHRAGGLGIMPSELSYSGWNFDILTGVSALALGGLLLRGIAIPRRVLFAWNLWGTACLTIIAFIAISSSPMLHLFGTDPANVNTWVLYFPYVLLPALLVTNALFSHVVIFRQLARGDSRSQ